MNRRLVRRTGTVLLLAGLIVSSCGPGSPPSAAVENYLKALAEKDQSAAVEHSCGEWEEQALAEGASFINVQVSLEDLSCQVDSESGASALVTCSGKYLFSYDAGEDQELDLSGRVFEAVKENGAWRMCGYR